MSLIDRSESDTDLVVESLLARWDDARARGEEIDVPTLCRDHPELAEEVARRIGALAEWDRFTETVDDFSVVPPVSRPPRGPIPQSALITLDLDQLRFHAQGGLGVIYKARDTGLGRVLAVKSARGPDGMFSSSEINRRFLREVRVTAALEHPGIVPVHGLGQDSEGRLCYAMRLIAGETLKKAISDFHSARNARPAKRRLPLRRDPEFRSLLQRLKSACVTVAYAHSRGFLHRDLKPDHILLGEFDSTLVVDWGLTKSINDPELTPIPLDPRRPQRSVPCTETGLGTLGFASPEQQAGDWSRVGPRSDVYSLGAILYVLLTDRLPFPGGSAAEILRLVESGTLIPPRKRNAEVPRPLEAICLKALAHSPRERYLTAQDLANDIERWLADVPVEAFKEPLAIRARRLIEQHSLWLLLTLAAAAGCLLAVAAGVHRGSLRQIELNSLTYATAERSAREQILTRQAGWLEGSLEEIGRARSTDTSIRSLPALRSLATACFEGVDLHDRDRFSSMPLGCVAFSPGGEWLAVGELFSPGACRIQLIETSTRRQLWEYTVPVAEMPTEKTGVTCIDFSRDGLWLAAGLRDGRVLVWQASTTRSEPQEVARHARRLVGLGFSVPDGMLASVSEDGQFVLAGHSPETGWSVLRRIPIAPRMSDLAITRDGLRVACVGDDGVFQQGFDRLRQGDVSNPFEQLGKCWTDCVDFSPRGSAMALPSHTYQTLTIGKEPSANGMVDPDLDVVHREATSDVAFSPDGSLIATGSADNTMKLWDVASARMLLRKSIFSESTVKLAFHPDGNALAVATSDGGFLYDIVRTEIRQTLGIGQGVVARFDFLPVNRPQDAPSLAILRAEEDHLPSQRGRLEIWRANGQQPERIVPGLWTGLPGNGFWALEASPIDLKVAVTLSDTLSVLDLSRPEAALGPLRLDSPSPVALGADGQTLWFVLSDYTFVSYSLNGRAERTRWRFSPPAETSGRVGISSLAAGRRFVVAGTRAGRLLVGKAEVGRLVEVARAVAPIQALALSPEESMIACGTQRGDLEVFTIEGRQVLSLRHAHSEQIDQVLFHPSGKYLATLSRERSLILWQIDSNSLVEIFRLTPPIQRAATMLRFSPDGRYLGVLIPSERAVRVWDLVRLRDRFNDLSLDWTGPSFVSSSSQTASGSEPSPEVEGQ